MKTDYVVRYVIDYYPRGWATLKTEEVARVFPILANALAFRDRLSDAFLSDEAGDTVYLVDVIGVFERTERPLPK